MSDWEYAEAFKAMREEGRKKRASNLENSLSMLGAMGILFSQLSPTHLRVGQYDFWPSTGLFIHTKTKQKGRGIRNLLKKVKPSAASSESPTNRKLLRGNE